jgi:hypothetical protein
MCRIIWFSHYLVDPFDIIASRDRQGKPIIMSGVDISNKFYIP